MDPGTFNTGTATEVADAVSVREGVEGGGVEAGVAVAGGMAGCELVAGAFVAAILLSRLI
jgi:hypothetical protein